MVQKINTIYIDSITSDRINILLDEDRIVVGECRGGKRTSYRFDPESEGWSYLKHAIEFYERSRILDGTACRE